MTAATPARTPLTRDTVLDALGAVEPQLGRVEVVARTASTSTDLAGAAAADPEAWPDRSVLVADHQEAGRGRAGRAWSTPPSAPLTVSVLLRPDVPPERLGWLPLVAGLAVARAVDDVTGVRATVKWPNDVLVATGLEPLAGWGRRRKVAGVLSELVDPHGPVVVLGIGVNVDQTAAELPVPSAASLRTLGVAVERAALLAAVLTRLVELDRRWRAGDVQGSGLAAECAAICSTVGQDVVVDLPGGGSLAGRAVGLGADGSLELVVDGARRTVLAGDVRHLRTEEDR